MNRRKKNKGKKRNLPSKRKPFIVDMQELWAPHIPPTSMVSPFSPSQYRRYVVEYCCGNFWLWF